MEEKKKPVNLWFSETDRRKLEELARANGMSISSLVRFLGAKVMDNPREFGLLPATAQPGQAVHRE